MASAQVHNNNNNNNSSSAHARSIRLVCERRVAGPAGALTTPSTRLLLPPSFNQRRLRFIFVEAVADRPRLYARGSTILYAWRRLQASCVRVFAAPADTRVMVLKLKHTLAAPSSAPRHRVMRRTAPPRALLAGTDRSIDSKIVASGLWGTHSIAASCRACGSCSA